MAYVKIWIHAVWTTKNREPLLVKNIRKTVLDHIKENARSKDIYIDYVNGYVEHVHALISMKSGQTISKIMQLIKGESAFWINKHCLKVNLDGRMNILQFRLVSPKWLS